MPKCALAWVSGWAATIRATLIPMHTLLTPIRTPTLMHMATATPITVESMEAIGAAVGAATVADMWVVATAMRVAAMADSVAAIAVAQFAAVAAQFVAVAVPAVVAVAVN